MRRTFVLATLTVLRFSTIALLATFCFLLPDLSHAQMVDVAIKVQLIRPQDSKRSGSGDVVIWLMPKHHSIPIPNQQLKYTLTQKDKQFTPHLLVVPTGASVDFPNLDPFFHNVFSLFNGKRFDLGLYEAHTQRSVQFDREGVSYIFCNIHPEMGAVVVSLSTPYYALSRRDGTVVLHNVPPGAYRLNVWAENVGPQHLNAAARDINVASENMQLESIQLLASGNLMKHHQNKFGDSYPPTLKDPY